MAVAVIGLIGVALGALMTQVGSVLADRRQSRTEAARWRRDQKAAAYDGALRHLLRTANRRSKITGEAGAIVSIQPIPAVLWSLALRDCWWAGHAVSGTAGIHGFPARASRIAVRAPTLFLTAVDA